MTSKNSIISKESCLISDHRRKLIRSMLVNLSGDQYSNNKWVPQNISDLKKLSTSTKTYFHPPPSGGKKAYILLQFSTIYSSILVLFISVSNPELTLNEIRMKDRR